MVSPEKIQEMRSVVNFWKFRVDENKRHLGKLVSREAAQADSDRCGQNYMMTLIEIKSRELSECQRGLRRAQASLGRLLEATGIAPIATETMPRLDQKTSPQAPAARAPNRAPNLKITPELSSISHTDLSSVIGRHRPTA